MFTGSYDPNPSGPRISVPLGQVPAVDMLLDEIELLNLQLLDQQDAAANYKTIHDNLLLRNHELEMRVESKAICNDQNEKLQADLTAATYKIRNLESDLKTEVGNRDHFRTLVAQQDGFIKELKVQVEQWKIAKNQETDAVRAELKTKTEEANHLARKAVEMSQQLATIAHENDLFRQRNNSLLEENRKLYDKSQDLECEGCRTGEMGAYCGGCLGCQLRQAEYTIGQMDERLEGALADRNAYRAMVTIQFSMISIMKPFIRQMTSRWFVGAEAELIIEEVERLQRSIEAECDKLMKNIKAKKTEVCGCTSEKCGDMIATTTPSVRQSPLPTCKDDEYQIPAPQPKAQAAKSLSETACKCPPLS